jgi:predicted PhzF superfamily epimerase YddE/YHI9
MTQLTAVLVEAFAAAPLQGNGAAVIWLEQPARAAWMQNVAASLRQSETAFLLQSPQGLCLRWFTPSCEVPLCGHATLAAALALGHWQRLVPGTPQDLLTASGRLQVELLPDQPTPAASLLLPSGPLQPAEAPAYLCRHFGDSPTHFWTSELGYQVALLPDGISLEALNGTATILEGPERLGLVVMQGHGGDQRVLGEPCDYQLRFFAPGLGIPEDPVTGSAHALVAPWWMGKLGRSHVVGWQPSDRCGGMLCELVRPGWVQLSGTGHLLWDGQIQAGDPGQDPEGWLKGLKAAAW